VLGIAALVLARRAPKPAGGARTVGVAAAAALALALPWSAYQRWYDPPGDRLLRWHLADAPAVDDPRSVGEALTDAYLHTPIADVLTYKAHNLRITVWMPERLGPYVGVDAWTDDGWRGVLRYEQLTSVLWTMGLLGFLAPLVLGAARRRACAGIAIVTAATWLGWCALQYGRGGSAAYAHHGPATLPLLLGWLGAVVVATAPRLAVRVAGVAGQVGLFALLWLEPPPTASGLPIPPAPAGSSVACGVLLALAVGAALVLVHRADDEPEAGFDPPSPVAAHVRRAPG
jgi:hypothetical protein